MPLLNFYKDKTVVLFGGASFVASFVIETLRTSGVKKVIAVDNSEDKTFWLSKKYNSQQWFQAIVGDVENLEHTVSEIGNFDVGIFLAAKKHVGLSEISPIPALNTNANAIVDVIRFCEKRLCKHFLYVSSDKAVNPTNVMGATKFLGEKISVSRTGNMICSVVRFGNVIGSPGSLYPILDKAVQGDSEFHLRGGDKTTRFFMQPSEAARLIISAAKLARGGEIFIMKMGAASISDFVTAFEKAFDVSIKKRTVELDPGEKEYEELINDSEYPFAKEFDDFIVIDLKNAHELKQADTIMLKTSHGAEKLSMQQLQDLIVTSKEEVSF